MIKDENYYVVHGWMKNVLGLKGNQLHIYAVLYGFTQDGQNEFRGTVEYIKEFIGAADRKTVVSGLTKLANLGYVRRIDYNTASGKTNGYICVPLEELGGIQKTDTPLPEKRIGGIQKTDTPLDKNIHYKEIYKETYTSKERKKEKYKNINPSNAREIFAQMTDEEFMEWGNSPEARECPHYYSLVELYYNESRRRARESAKPWRGKLIVERGMLKTLQSHEEVMDDYNITGAYREKVKEFLKACYANGHVIINTKLDSILFELTDNYSTDEERIAVLNDAINGGYNDIRRLK